MIIIIFYFMLTQVILGWPSWHLIQVLLWVIFWNYDNNHFLFYVDPPDTWSKFYYGSTTESSFKTMIIIIFILMLTRVNDQPHSWSGPCPGSTLESDFKTMVITTFILTLTRINLGQLDQWLKFCHESTIELSFKTIIMIIYWLFFSDFFNNKMISVTDVL